MRVRPPRIADDRLRGAGEHVRVPDLPGAQAPVILKVLDPRRCRPRALERQKKEYEVGRTLDLPTVARPRALETYQGLPTLVIADFGGEPLDRLLGVPMPVERFLALAVR